MRVSLFLVLLSFGASVFPTEAATYYVAPHGLDSNPGTEAQPLRTFGRAVRVARPGDTFIFEDGLYPETQYPWIETTLGTATASTPIVFKSRRKHGAVLVFQNLVNEKILIRQRYVTIQDFEITQNVKGGGNDHMIYAYTGSSHVRIIGNRIHNMVKDCVKGHKTDYLVVVGNQCFNSDNEGIDVLNSYDVTVADNEIWNVRTAAILLKGGGRDFKVFNNHIRASAPMTYGIALGGQSCTGCTFDFSGSGYEAYNSIAFNNTVVSNPAGLIDHGLALIGTRDSGFVNNVVIGAKSGISIITPRNTLVGWAWDPLDRNPVIVNNIVQDCSQRATSFNTASIQGTFTHDYNTYFNCPSPPSQAHGSVADPMFVDKLKDWRLRDGSPSASTGTVVPPRSGYHGAVIDVAFDRDGVPRVAPWDRGVYVMRNGAPLPPTNLRIVTSLIVSYSLFRSAMGASAEE